MEKLEILIMSAAFLGFFHTLVGPDHYLPFIVLSKARKWSVSKTLWITFISGVGHVGGSVILGIIGIAMGISLGKLEAIESHRGEIVGWLLISFGIIYTLYGIKKFVRNGGHFHLPKFLIPKKLRKMHHFSSHHYESKNEDNTRLTPWILFIIFIFGPCEVLIPLLIFPAAQFNTFGIVAVSLIFGITTILTMLITVFIGTRGLSFIRFSNAEKFSHLVAGLVILFSGVGMQFLGL